MMDLEKRISTNLTASILLVLSGLVVGYVGHDFLAPGPEHSPAAALSRGGAVTLEPEAESADRSRETMLMPVSEATQRKKDKAANRQSAERYEQMQDSNALLEEEITGGFGLDPGVSDSDPNLDFQDDPDLIAPVVSEREAAYHQHLQSVAESAVSQHPAALEPDEDESENLYGDLPIVGEQEALEMLKADEQTMGFHEPEPELETLIPHEEDLPHPAY